MRRDPPLATSATDTRVAPVRAETSCCTTSRDRRTSFDTIKRQDRRSNAVRSAQKTLHRRGPSVPEIPIQDT
ncbi:acyltransferase, partial [Pseudomonas aeruginosa]|nr:acyltransferase [Pseudomonas aeruginosa]